MLVVAPGWSGPGYPWFTALCTFCPKKWCFPEGRPVYLRGGRDLVPAHFIHELATGRLDLLDPATRGPDGHATEW